MEKKPIGIFDSGVGGLTVFRAIREMFPDEDLIYFGDTARVPYGPKSRHTVIEYSIQNARFLLQQGAKIIVIACNTSASVALQTLAQTLPVPVIGVIEPGAIAAVEASQNGKIGVIGTEGTIQSQAYPEAINRLAAQSETFSQACPLFVSLAEEGWENHQVSKIIAEEYLQPLIAKEIDTLVLGCTHYPILKQTIQSVLGSQVRLVDSAQAISQQLCKIFPASASAEPGTDRFYVSDNKEKFAQIAAKILGKTPISLTQVKLGESWYF
ncbi:MAG: glutamate racemase [Candidatus Cloacimonadales bacterium]